MKLRRRNRISCDRTGIGKRCRVQSGYIDRCLLGSSIDFACVSIGGGACLCFVCFTRERYLVCFRNDRIIVNQCFMARLTAACEQTYTKKKSKYMFHIVS